MKIRIRYRGGPLNGRSFNGHPDQPKYRKGDGTTLTHSRGYALIMGARELGGIADVYCLDASHTVYEHLGTLVTEERTRRIKALIEHAQANPQEADRDEDQIRLLETSVV